MFLSSVCKNKNFLYKCLGSFIQKFFFLWHKQQLLFKKIYKYPFFFLSLFCTNISSIPPPHLITFNCTLSYLIPRRELPPPSPVEHFVFTHSRQRLIMGGGLPLMRSLCRGMAVAGRDGASSSALCTGRVGSSHSSPPPTGTGCAESEVAGQAPNHSSSHWCSPWPSLLSPFDWGHSHCRRHPCCRGSWEVQNAGSCKACSCSGWGDRWEQC